ncbi:hypothetical protein ACVR0P_02875 [Streptococcus castoreus]|uniref:hypothetical protein n=1 Tax=Streptococcus castoreus TaxID=254786 RepID=UPI0012EC96F8|nr:hypothetical protein [Streptococcus castoreus]
MLGLKNPQLEENNAIHAHSKIGISYSEETLSALHSTGINEKARHVHYNVLAQ